MADKETTFRLKFDNSDMVKVYDQMIDKNEQVTVGLKDLEDRFEAAFKEGAKSVKEQNKELVKQVNQIDQNKAQWKDFESRIKAQKNITRELNEEYIQLSEQLLILGKQGGKDADNIKDRMKAITVEVRKSRLETSKLQEAFRENSKRIKEQNKGVDEFFNTVESKGGQAGGIISSIGRKFGLVGAIVVGVGGAIVAAFLSLKENSKTAKRELEGLKAVGNELKDRVFAGLRSAVKVFGDIGGAAQEMATAFGNGRDSLAEVNQKGKDFFDLQNSIAESNRSLIRTEAERAVQLQKLQLLAGDETKTTAERITLIRSAAAIENEINQNRIAQLGNELQLRQSENSLYGEQEGSLDAIAAIEAELIELRGTSQVINIQTQQSVNALLKEEAEIRERIIGQIKDANALITNQQAERSLEKQIQSFKELRDSIAGAGLADEYKAELAELDRVIDGLSNRLSDGLAKPLEQLPSKISGTLQIGSLTAESLSDELERGAEDAINNLEKAFGKKFKATLGDLSDEQKKFLQDQFKDILNSVGEIVIQSTLTQIDRQNEVVDARENSISELERQLQEQEKLEGQGLANQSSRLKQSLQQERELLKSEQARRLELEKKAARQRLISNSLQQGSELTLATAKLLNQGASGFIPGLIAAVGGIALLFRIIAQSKANAAAFSAPPKFRKGTEYLQGQSHEDGGILAELEHGERVLSKIHNDKIGGAKVSNQDLVDFALKGMNAEQAIAPMAAVIASGAASQNKIEAVQAWERNDMLAQVFREEIGELKEEMRNVIRERPTYYSTEVAGRREYYKGGTKVIEKIKPK